MLISCVINCDTRPERNNENGLSKGVVSRDFLTYGIENKIKFLEGFEKEIILFVDEHERMPEKQVEYLRSIVDCLVIRRHTEENKFNDNNYVAALSLARGEYVFHFDHDTAAFTNDQKHVRYLLNRLEVSDYISYPSRFSPNPDHNDNYDYWWASTRFFVCKKETLDITEIKKCLADSEYLYGKYPASVRNPWTEHICGLMAKYNGKGVYYPPINNDEYMIFSWGNYQPGLWAQLHEMPYEAVKDFVNSKSFNYANDIFV